MVARRTMNGKRSTTWARRFAGRAALVTASGAGIGEAIALEWATGRGSVVVADLLLEQAEGVAEAVGRGGGQARAVQMDVNDPGAAEQAVAEAVEAFGRLDVLFNVAGVNLPKNVEEMDDIDWYRIVDTNLTSVYRCARQAIPVMRAHGGGAIVNVASTAGILAENRCAAYSASKGGVIQLTRNMALDFARDSIRVNAICPGSTMTPRIQSYLDRFPGHERMLESLAPMQRFAEPREIARPAVFLASDDASYITGAVLVVDGGLTAGTRFPIFDEV